MKDKMTTEALRGKESLNEQEKLRNNTTRGLSNLRQDVMSERDVLPVNESIEQKKEKVQACINHLRLVVDEKYYKDVMEKNTEATIKSVQYLLRSKGYDVGKVDGILVTKGKKTSKTMEAIKEFQRDTGLKVDGIPGKETINTLLIMYHSINEMFLYNRTEEKGSKVKSFNFSEKKSISDKQAELLSKVKYLELDGLRSLSDEQAKILSSGNIRMLFLNGLTSITDNQAKLLSKIRNLYLDGLTSLTDNQAESFSKISGLLSLRGLTSLTDNQAEILLSGNIKGLFLNGLTSLSDNQVKLLSKIKDLELDGLTSISDDQAKSLSKVRYLSLRGLTSITDTQARLLSKVEHLSISRRILTPKQKEILKIDDL